MEAQETVYNGGLPDDDHIAEIYREAFAEIDAHNKRIKKSNDRLLKVLKAKMGVPWVKGLKALMKECEVYGWLRISRRKPNQRDWQKENFGPIKEMWVSQRSVGDSGDSFEGEIWVQIDKRRYLELHFAT